MQIEVVDIKDGKFYSGGTVNGSTLDIVLRRENDDGSVEFASCEGILYMEDEGSDALNDIFDEWASYAMNGEEGYNYWEA